MPSKNFEIELKKVYPVSFPVKELSQHNDSLKELCESFLNLQLDTEHSIIMNPYIKCAIGINVVFYWGICNKYVKCLKIEIPQIIKQAFVKIIKYGGMEGRVHPAIQYEFAKTVSSHSHDVDFAHNMLKVSAKNQIAMVYSRFLTNLLSNLTSQLELKKKFILLTCQRVATPSWNMISALRQFLYVIVNEYKNAILRDISNEDEFLILEAIKDTQLFRSPLDCAGQSLVLRSTLLINAKEAVKEKSACIKKFIKILSFELENLCGKYVYGKHEEDFKKLCCFGLMCGGLNSERCRLNIDLRESVNEGSNRHEFYFIFRIGFDVKFVLEPLIDFNTIGLREYFG
ncbi:hypothetical protein HDU92_005962 [Lobulomyces angularis]|nr:hypothetical protein HDU92_005962 [Lobulomyces angularis]